MAFLIVSEAEIASFLRAETEISSPFSAENSRSDVLKNEGRGRGLELIEIFPSSGILGRSKVESRSQN